MKVPPTNKKSTFGKFWNNDIDTYTQELNIVIDDFLYDIDITGSLSFNNLSPGQKLTQIYTYIANEINNNSNPTILLIDQPEDQVGNETMLDFSRTIRELTNTKALQVIFVTHNGNVVVNGDSNQIISVTKDENTIKVTNLNLEFGINGDKIINSLDGGKEAIRERMRIYENW